MSRWIGSSGLATLRRPSGRWSGDHGALVSGIVPGMPHAIGDVEEEVNSLHTEMMTFGQELANQLFLQDDVHRGWDLPRPGVSPDKLSLYKNVWRPLMNEWIKFHETHSSSFWQNLPFGGTWDRVQDFRKRLIAIREEAKKADFRLQSPDPTPPKTDDMDVKKVAIVAGAGLVGLAALILIARR
jgi:hypothetical protein